MKKLLLWLLLAGMAGAAPPKTLRDYYRLLPKHYFPLGRRDVKLQIKGGAIVDEANGYLKIFGDGGQADVVLALFRNPDGSALAGATWGGDSYDDHGHFVHFYRWDGSRLSDVTSQVLPREAKLDWVYVLPREGTTVQLYKLQGHKLTPAGALTWKAGRFLLQP